MSALLEQGKAAKAAAAVLSISGIEKRNEALRAMAKAIEENEARIIEQNAMDLARARAAKKSEAFIERLTLNPQRVKAMAQGLLDVVALPDPLGKVLDGWTRPNGLRIERCSVPLGVIGIIYESRPNVTADAAALCLKSGNACILRGGSDAIDSNRVICDVMTQAIESVGLPAGCVSLVQDTSRETANALMKMTRYLDVLIPRGGASLIQSVIKNAKVPVIETGTGNCHTYVDGACNDLDMAKAVVLNAKVSRPSVCNAMETLLVDQKIAKRFLPDCVAALQQAGVEVRGCAATRRLCPLVAQATEKDYFCEFNSLTLAVKVVKGVDAAMAHIAKYGTRHSEAILTHDVQTAERFMNGVDAAVVYLNASTRFTDGGEFGFGAEIGISNQKLHARGPMGLEQMTTVKYRVSGDGQIR